MIRMGRNSKPEPQPQPAQYPEAKNNQPYNYSPQQHGESSQFRAAGDAAPSAASNNRAFTESESLARDIKEGRLSGYVGSGTVLTGDTNFKAMLRVDGHLTGRVISDGGTLVVGANGQVDANIAVAAAVINGLVNGDIMATERIELGRTAKVVGNIQAPSLTMEPGALLEGNCSMVKPRAELEKLAQQKLQNERAASEAATEMQPDSDEIQSEIGNFNSNAATA